MWTCEKSMKLVARGRDGFLHGIHKKHVLWNHEYTQFEAAAASAEEPYLVHARYRAGIVGFNLR